MVCHLLSRIAEVASMHSPVGSDKTLRQSLPVDMTPGVPNPPEHLALVVCLDSMQSQFRPGRASEGLKHLLCGPGLTGGDPYEWMLCRWSECDTDEVPTHQHNVSQNDVVVWCDPDDFGEEYHLRVYPDEQFKRILEHTFGVWAQQMPERKTEYAAALAEHGLQLAPAERRRPFDVRSDDQEPSSK